jgi:hypothetical protein
MIMSYSKAALVELHRLGNGPGVEIKQVRKVTSSSHRQPPGDPTDGHRRFGAQLGRQLHLEGMPLAPACDLVFGNASGAQRLRNKKDVF